MSALVLPRIGQKVVLFQNRDVRPGSDRHLDELDRPRHVPANRIEHLLPLIKTNGGDITPKVIMARVPGTAPLQALVSRIVAQRSVAKPAVAQATAS